MVLITKEQKRIVYTYLLDEGVLVVKKDVHLDKHQHLGIPNLNVICIMKTLKSKKYVNELFCWNWWYWTVSNDGVKFLREALGAPDVVPSTFKRPAKKPGEEEEEYRGERRFRGRGDFQGTVFYLNNY